MNHGSGWVLIEEYFHSGRRNLISILPPRMCQRDVASYVVQTYVDRYASVREKLSYKKRRKSSAYFVSSDHYGRVMHCGHEPSFVCIYAEAIHLKNGVVEFEYNIVIGINDDSRPILEPRRQTIVVEVEVRK